MFIFQTEYADYIKKQYIIDTVNNIFPRIRKSKYTNEYFVDQILDCNLNFASWASLGKTFGKYTNKSKYHHKYLNEIYLKWADADVFKIAYKNIIMDNLNYDPKNLKLNTDVTCISNMYGKENVGVNPEYAKKNVTKVAFLNTTKIGKPTSIWIMVWITSLLRIHLECCHIIIKKFPFGQKTQSIMVFIDNLSLELVNQMVIH